jgi:hypothetical protein
MRKDLRDELRKSLMKIHWAADTGHHLRMKECMEDMFRVVCQEAMAALNRLDREDKAEAAEAVEPVEEIMAAAESDPHR